MEDVAVIVGIASPLLVLLLGLTAFAVQRRAERHAEDHKRKQFHEKHKQRRHNIVATGLKWQKVSRQWLDAVVKQAKKASNVEVGNDLAKLLDGQGPAGQRTQWHQFMSRHESSSAETRYQPSSMHKLAPPFLEINKDDWKELGITGLRWEDYIKFGDSYFQPAFHESNGFVPLMYELNEEKEYQLEKSEGRARIGGKGARDSLASEIRQVTAELTAVRERRISEWNDINKQCSQTILNGGASSVVYEAVFQTIVGQESEEMREYEAAAEALRNRLLADEIAPRDSDDRLEWPKCKQRTADLAELYMEAVSVKDRARDVMNSLLSTESKDSVRDSFRHIIMFEMSPLKKMRCAAHLRTTSPPLIVVSCVRLQSRM